MLKFIPVFFFIVASMSVQAHTVILGTAVVKGACAVLDNNEESKLLIYRQQSNFVRYVDGTAETTAIIFPTKPLPNNAPDELMTNCARSAYKNMPDQTASTAVPEDLFKNKLNQCLSDNNAPYQASLVVLRRGGINCPPKAVRNQ